MITTSTDATTPDDPAAASRRAPALPPDERRAAIINAALPLLRVSGRRVTTREIADAAGIAEGTIFRVFDTKDDLIHAVVEHTMDVSETIEAILAIDGLAPLQDRVRACITILSERLKSVFEIMFALHPRGRPDDNDGKAGPAANADHQHHARTLHDTRQAALLDAIATVFEPSETDLSCSPRRAAGLLRTLAFSRAHPMIAGNEELTADEIAEVLLHGIVRTGRLAETGHPPLDDVIPAAERSVA